MKERRKTERNERMKETKKYRKKEKANKEITQQRKNAIEKYT